jgi:uncharacterized membrane protein
MKKLLRFLLSGVLLLIPILILFWFLEGFWGILNIYSGKILILLNIKETIITKIIVLLVILFAAGLLSKYISLLTSKKIKNYLEKKLGNVQGKIVLIEPTREGFYELGIVTKEFSNYVVVFVPTFPTIFTGSVRIVEKNKVKFVDMNQQELINFVITAGIIIPQNLSKKLTQNDESGDK